MRRKIIFFVLFIHNYTYIYSKGRLGKTISDRPCLILETIGGKTGKLRKNVLVFLKEKEVKKLIMMMVNISKKNI